MWLSKKKRRIRFDEAFDTWNDEETDWEAVNREMFDRYNIRVIRDLERFMSKNCEYGGLVFDSAKKKVILLPFHHDFMNSWLKFDDQHVIEFYGDYYDNNKKKYRSKDEFDKRFFETEEVIQLNNWMMPKFDERIFKYPIMGCWDKVEIEALFLECHGKEVRRVCCHDGNKMRGHTFLCFYDAGIWKKYMTSVITLKADNFEKLCKKAHSLLKHVPIYSNPKRCELIEYDKPPILCKGTEFVEILEKGRIIIPCNGKG